jgi:septin family protein
LGKTTFINTLFSTTIKNYADHKKRHAKQIDKTVEIEITKAELEEKFFKGRVPFPHAIRSRSLTTTSSFDCH